MDIYAESLKSFLEPVWRYVDDERISEILINGPDSIWVEMKGTLYKTKAKFTPDGLLAAARNIAQYVGRVINDDRPRLDARLPDGSRIHVVLPPIARCGTIVSIRKFFPGGLTIDQMISFGSITSECARFIEACVLAKENVVVSGGTGSGKTTLLNVVSNYIPNNERIITIEDSAELQLSQDHLVPLESRPADEQGRGAVTMRDLLHSSLRLRPDRIVIGEVRGGEAFDLLQAMNTGHGGSMCTTHANTPKETLARIESLALFSGIELPLVAVRAQVAAAIHVVISCARFSDGSRKVTHVSEVLPLNEKGEYRVQDIFIYNQTHKDENGKIHGYHTPTGILPRIQRKLLANGFEDMTDDFFTPGTYGLEPPKYFEDGK
ncbi:MAG: CpaF family protein [Deltaproteobacteria bacterium]|nr:CpaF family protein [Deltaproteobacteria bacterium]